MPTDEQRRLMNRLWETASMNPCFLCTNVDCLFHGCRREKNRRKPVRTPADREVLKDG
jgi:hypothetical protein